MAEMIDMAAPPQSGSLRSLYAAALADIEAEQQRSGVADLPLAVDMFCMSCVI